MRAFLLVVRRELRLTLRHGGEAVTVVLFFALGAMLFPFGVGPEPNMLARIAAGVIWVMALFAAMLSLERLFQGDFEDGSLELLALTPLPLEAVALAKALGHWLTTGVPLVVAAPVLGLMLNLPASSYAVLLAAMALGTPVLSLVGALGAALTLGARRGGVLIALLALPLLVPVLIFGAGAVEAQSTGIGPGSHLSALGGLLIAALTLCPWATAAALRQALE